LFGPFVQWAKLPLRRIACRDERERGAEPLSWVEVFAVLIVSHLAGDFLLQTDWQARFKEFGLGPGGEHRRALVSHVLSYMLAFVPALVWIGIEAGFATAILTAVVVAVPHLVQDDRRLLDAYMRRVKGLDASSPGLRIAVDQAFHVLFLFATALLVAA
jgi:hypothetical protein